MISVRLRNQLTLQFEDLRKQNRELLEDIAALGEILGVNVTETPKAINLTQSSRRNGKITFASHIRDALTKIEGPAKAIQVANVLEFQGIRTKAKTTLAINVACELARLHDRPNSGVKRISTGLYALETAGVGNGNGAG